MSITLYQIEGGEVPPVADARLWDFVGGGALGVVEGINVTTTGGLNLAISDGWGVVQGRAFEVSAETITAIPSTSGIVSGRLLIRIDIAVPDSPISFVTQAEAQLPALTQEDINADGTIYEMVIATFNVDEIQITDLVSSAPIAESGEMPKSGGAFTGAVTAASTTDTAAQIRNIVVVDAGTDLASLSVPAGTIIMEKK